MKKTPDTVSAQKVAEYIISAFYEKDKEIDEGISEGVSNLKLQKLFYFCQSFSLVRLEKPMFQEKIYAWKYGPVVKEVYAKYRKHKNNPIPPTKKPELDEEYTKVIDEVLQIFGGYSPIRLMNITHSHKPWRDLESKVKKGKRDIEITNKALQKYYMPIL